jgi:hypothetical protein
MCNRYVWSVRGISLLGRFESYLLVSEQDLMITSFVLVKFVAGFRERLYLLKNVWVVCDESGVL